MIGQPKAGFVPDHVGSLGLGYSRNSLRSYVKARVNEMDGVADGPRKRGKVASTGDETPILGWLSNWCLWRRGTPRDSNRFRQAWRYGQRTSVHEGLTE